MSNEIENASDLLPEGMDQELLQELEQQSLDQIRKLRAHQRFEVRVPLHVRPGNASSTEPTISGETVDVSSGGCAGTFPVPVGVGDVFRITIDDEQLAVPLVFGRCLRCRLVREDAFEAAFSFFTQIGFEFHDSDDGDLL